MERGYLKIEERGDKQLVVTAQFVDSTVWLTKHEIADLFNVFVNNIGNNIRYLFKSGLLCKEVVTRIQKTEINGCYSETIYYNLEVIVFLSCRINSLEAKAFRIWMLESVCSLCNAEQKKVTNVLNVYSLNSNLPSIILN